MVYYVNYVLLLTLTLTFQLKTMSLVGFLKVIHYTKFEHFGIIRFWVMLQTNRQKDSKILPTPMWAADQHSRRG